MLIQLQEFFEEMSSRISQEQKIIRNDIHYIIYDKVNCL